MRRYEIVDELKDDIQGREDISVIDPAIDDKLLLTNTYTRYFDKYSYNQDVHVNRYDLNRDILDEIIDKKAYSLLWVIDPSFLTLKMATKMAQVGGGEYLPREYQKMWEIAVLRYIAGERDFYNHNDFYTTDRLLFDSDYAAADLDGYIYNFISEQQGYVEREKRGYLFEEERKEAEVKKLRKINKR